MKRIFKSIRNNPVINRILRFIIITLNKLLKSIVKYGRIYVPVSGRIRLDIDGEEIVFYTKGDDHFVNWLYYFGITEKEELQLFQDLIKHSKCFFDIGANIGLYSLFAAKVNPETKILSFEANPFVYNRFLKNIELNGLHSIKTYSHVIGKEEGQIDFFVPNIDVITTNSSVIECQAGAFFNNLETTAIKKQQKSIDTLISKDNLPIPDLIKFDIELNELNGLIGSKHLLAKHQPNLLIEVFNDKIKVEMNPSLNDSLEPGYTSNIECFLKECGYFIYVIGINGILRVQDFRSNPDCTNYFCTKKELKKPFYKWDDIQEFAQNIYI